MLRKTKEVTRGGGPDDSRSVTKIEVSVSSRDALRDGSADRPTKIGSKKRKGSKNRSRKGNTAGK